MRRSGAQSVPLHFFRKCLTTKGTKFTKEVRERENKLRVLRALRGESHSSVFNRSESRDLDCYQERADDLPVISSFLLVSLRPLRLCNSFNSVAAMPAMPRWGQ